MTTPTPKEPRSVSKPEWAAWNDDIDDNTGFYDKDEMDAYLDTLTAERDQLKAELDECRAELGEKLHKAITCLEIISKERKYFGALPATARMTLEEISDNHSQAKP